MTTTQTSWAYSSFASLAWQPDALAMLDDSHLVAWSAAVRRQNLFSASLQQFIGTQRDTDACILYGQYVDDLESFCHQLERVLPGPRLARRIDGPDGIVDLLRSRQTFLGRPATRFRYFVWNDAGRLLLHDRDLFGAIIEAFAGVAAEQEFVTDDMLLIQRLLLVGGEELREYSRDPNGQCRVWRSVAGGPAFWRLATGVDQPRFGELALDRLQLT